MTAGSHCLLSELPLRREIACALWLVCLLFAAVSTAQPQAASTFGVGEVTAPELSRYSVPPDLSGVHFYLITVNVGNRVYDNFGHTALRVLDENTNTDTIFDWGVFDLSGRPLRFSFDFFKGIMRYRLATGTPARAFAHYRDQQQTVWQDKINLTNPQKAIFYRRLLWNLEPDNVEYDYQYFFDNCTTRVRDYLNEALNGRIEAYSRGDTETTFRQQVRAHYESLALVGFSLDILMNGNIDRPVSEWENMFLPLNLRRQLAAVPSDVAEAGRRKMLLSDAHVVMEFPPPRVQSDPYRIASGMLLIPALFLGFMLKRIPMSYFATHSRVGLKAPSLSFRVMGVTGLITAVFSGVYGALMLGSWFVSDHLDLHHNVNLLLFWPTDLLGIFLALRWLLFCKPWPLTHNSAPFVNYYLLAHVLGLLAYWVVAGAGLSAQTIAEPAFYVAPGLLLLLLLFWVVGFEPAKPKNMFF